jgi:hypothetical protein
LSPELRLIVAPRQTYAALSRVPATVSAVGALRRPALAALVVGASVAILSTGRGAAAHVKSPTHAGGEDSWRSRRR